jgi:hypothetical protein
LDGVNVYNEKEKRSIQHSLSREHPRNAIGVGSNVNVAYMCVLGHNIYLKVVILKVAGCKHAVTHFSLALLGA